MCMTVTFLLKDKRLTRQPAGDKRVIKLYICMNQKSFRKTRKKILKSVGSHLKSVGSLLEVMFVIFTVQSLTLLSLGHKSLALHRYIIL